MNAPFAMFKQQTFDDLLNATFSPASAGGATHSSLPACPPPSGSGPAPAPARLSAAQRKRSDAQRVTDVLYRALVGLVISSASSASTHGTPTTVTCIPSCIGSCATAARQSSLESRLRALMDGYGSLEFELRWNSLAMPFLPPILQRQALARRTSGSDCSGWPTPAARDHQTAHSPEYVAAKKAQGHGMANLNDVVMLAGWPTCRANDGTGASKPHPTRGGESLQTIAQRVEVVGGGETANGLGDAVLAGLEGQSRDGNDRDQSRWNDTHEKRPITETGAARSGGLGDTETHGCEGREPVGPRTDGHVPSGEAGHWDNFDILHFTDGKARRIEPGTFPLADGVPARVVRLRGYGNAINPQVAAIFLKACPELFEEGAIK